MNDIHVNGNIYVMLGFAQITINQVCMYDGLLYVFNQLYVCMKLWIMNGKIKGFIRMYAFFVGSCLYIVVDLFEFFVAKT